VNLEIKINEGKSALEQTQKTDKAQYEEFKKASDSKL